MPRKAKLSITDSRHARRPDFSIPAAGAKRHDATANYFAEAARHRRQAAKLNQSGHPEKASPHSQLRHAPYLHSGQDAEQTAKDLLKNQRFSIIWLLEF
jgi:hypothetical protein